MLSQYKPSLLLIFFFMLLIAGVRFFDRQVVEWSLPLYRQALELLTPNTWQIDSLRVLQEGREAFIAVRVETVAPSILGGSFIPTGIGMTGFTLLGHAFEPPLIILTLLISWLAMAPGRRLGPAILVLPFILLVVCMDVPLLLVGSLWDILHANYAPGSSLPWQAWAMNLLNSGGRQALSLAAALSAIALGTWMQERVSLLPFLWRKRPMPLLTSPFRCHPITSPLGQLSSAGNATSEEAA